MARDDAGSSRFTAVQISMQVGNVGRVTDPFSPTSLALGGAVVRSRCLFCMVRELYCLYLPKKEVSGNIFIYLNNFMISEKVCGFVIADSEWIPENGRKPI